MMMKNKEQSPAPAAKNGFSLISEGKLLAIYSAMLKCRMLQERMRILLRMNHLNGNNVAGQEAAVAGVVIDLLPEDSIRSYPNDLIHFFIRDLRLGGGSLERVFMQSLNSAPALSISEQLKLAIDDAIVCKANNNNRITVIFYSSEYIYHDSLLEALRVAGTNRLPILFVLQEANARVSAEPKSNGGRIRTNAKTYGFPAIAVEGNDAVAVYRVACEAIAHARKGDGPTLIECQRWQDGDPLLNMETYLDLKGLFSEEYKRHVEAGFLEELDAAEEVAEQG